MTDDELDRVIDHTLAGRPRVATDAVASVVVSRLVAGYRAAAPPGLADVVGAAIARAEYQRRLPVRLAALVVAVLFALEGLGNLFNGDWVAANLDVPYDSHAFYESGVMFLAVALVVGVSVVRTKWLDAAVLAGVPDRVVARRERRRRVRRVSRGRAPARVARSGRPRARIHVVALRETSSERRRGMSEQSEPGPADRATAREPGGDGERAQRAWGRSPREDGA